MCDQCPPNTDYAKPGRFISVSADDKLDVVNTKVDPIYCPVSTIEDRPQGLVNGQSGDRDLEEVVAAAFVRCFRLWQQRQRKYGRGNISRHGALGCLIRDTDKTARLERYYLEGKKEELSDESVVDSWMDKVNYALMGLVCFEKNWPGSPEAK